MVADWVKNCDVEKIINEILPALKKDINAFQAGNLPSNLCITIPKPYRPYGKVQGLIAGLVFGGNVHEQIEELRCKLERKRAKIKEKEKEKSKLDNKITTVDYEDENCTIYSNEDLMSRLQAKWSCSLEHLMTKMRNAVANAQAEHKHKLKKASNPTKAIEQPEALPISKYPSAEDFKDIINFLKHHNLSNKTCENGTLNSNGRLDLCKQGITNAFYETSDAVVKDGEQLSQDVHFKYGTMNSDGRLDLCKQGFTNAFYETSDAVVADLRGQTSICKVSQHLDDVSITQKPFVKHFLIGNNRIGEDGDHVGEGKKRVIELSRLIQLRPDIVTWYLAGNSLDHLLIRYVAEALQKTDAKYIWLKMNPVKTGSYYLGKMLMRTPSILLLDLFNCGLCNDGIREFVRGLSEVGQQSPSLVCNLQHLYLSINAISSTEWFEPMLMYLSQLHSLFIGMNSFGDEGFEILSNVIINKSSCCKTLQRLTIDSLALSDVSLPFVANIANACSKLVCLELGSYKSTNYFDLIHNQFDVKQASSQSALVAIAQSLVYNAKNRAVESGDSELFHLHYLGLQHALIVELNPANRTLKMLEVKNIIDDFVYNKLHKETGVNVNGITNLYISKDSQSCKFISDLREKRGHKNLFSIKVAGGIFYCQGVTQEVLRTSIRNPWPALDHIKSIYRNIMKS
ncbi:uncharacterized protein LOC124445589 isoform X2 [Xenia sp. Carnegie-2017]|uniref:uncharacterized protein LOC124445589 isoform X2 n=1 Tax=Xenia sp. Carnegie-2017 TaxID=2897299 RepID=UPI001F045363|nr:uncharacterized protein LOC124445589 isoform X2 [Xenia sp. Carnegie-2017]